MSNLLKSKFLLGVMVVAIMFVGVVAVSAGTASADCSITSTLKMGSKGSQVACLQTALGGLTADGNFGAKTKAAVMAFQANAGLTADGVFGSKSNAVWVSNAGNSNNFPAGCASNTGYSTTTGQSCAGSSNLPAGCTSTSGYSPTTGSKCDSSSSPSTPTGPLAGTDGSISTITTLSQYSDEEVGEGQNDVKVAGFELETSNDGDISLKSMKLVFDPTGNGAGISSHVDDYFKSVAVWDGSTKIGSADLADFTKNSNGTYSKVVTVSDVVRSDKTQKFYISVDAANSFDSGDIATDDWSVGIQNIRYEDGSGVVTTDTSSYTTGAGEIGWDSTDDGIEINAVSFSASSDTELKISVASDSPEAGIVVVSDTATTDNVVLLKGKLKLEGTSNVLLDQFPVTFGAVTSNMNVVASSIRLMLDSEEFSEPVPSIAADATASITFDNLDFNIDAGDTVNFKIVAEIADASDFTAGASLTASVTSTNRSFIDAENDEGDQLASGEKTGTAGGEAQSFRTTGISVALVSATSTKSPVDADNGDSATFVLKFTVTAVGDTVYVASVASPDGAMANAYTLDYNGTATATDQSAVLVNVTDTDLTPEGVYLIEDGESETFEMTVVRNPSATDGLYRVSLTNIKWDIDDDSTPDITYNTNLDTFKTPYVALD